MPETVKLYDLTKSDYPNQRGDSFRSIQVFVCWVCDALSNKVIMGGHPGYGVRAKCPNSAQCWHHEFEEKMLLLREPHPKSYKDELQNEINELKRQHGPVKNDLKGDPDMSLPRRAVTNTKSYQPGSECTHL